jgi:hypothetical protein
MSATATTHALEATGLRKTFGDTIAVDGLDLAVEEGCPRVGSSSSPPPSSTKTAERGASSPKARWGRDGSA